MEDILEINLLFILSLWFVISLTHACIMFTAKKIYLECLKGDADPKYPLYNDKILYIGHEHSSSPDSSDLRAVRLDLKEVTQVFVVRR